MGHVKIKDKRIIESWGSKIEIKGINPLGIFKLYESTDEALVHTIDDQEKENVRLRKRTFELEATLNPTPLFAEPLVVMIPNDFSNNSFKKVLKVDKAAKLLNGI